MTSTVLVSQPGIMRDSLHAILKSLPRVEVVGAASGGLSADKLLKKQAIQLMVVDANLPQEEVLALVGRVKEHHPRTRCMVLTTTTKHDQKLLAVGADAVLLRNSSAQALADAVQQTKPS